MTSLRTVLNCVHSASFGAIITNETWESKIVQGIYSLLYFSCREAAAPSFPLPSCASVEQGYVKVRQHNGPGVSGVLLEILVALFFIKHLSQYL